MESIYLKKFLENVGYAIHALNTICVGLNSVAVGDVVKPDDLVITWKPKDFKNSSLISRTFAIKATYVFMTEAICEYMNYVKHVFVSESDLKEYNELQNSEKIEKIFSVVDLDNKYRLVMLKLLIHTRNRIVHNRSKADLSSREKDILKEQREILFPIVKYMINPGYADIEENMTLLEKTNAAINAVFSSISTLVAEKIIK